MRGWAGRYGPRGLAVRCAQPHPTSGRLSSLPGTAPPSLPPTGSPLLPHPYLSKWGGLPPRCLSSFPSLIPSVQSPHLTHRLYLPNPSGPISCPSPSPPPEFQPRPEQPPAPPVPGSPHSAPRPVVTRLKHAPDLPFPRQACSSGLCPPPNKGGWLDGKSLDAGALLCSSSLGSASSQISEPSANDLTSLRLSLLIRKVGNNGEV